MSMNISLLAFFVVAVLFVGMCNSFNRANAVLHDIVSISENLINFMHFRRSYTRNGDHYILLIMTGNAHKESCHKLSSKLVRKKIE